MLSDPARISQPSNARLLSLIRESSLDVRDSMEILRIFPYLSPWRQQQILDTWVTIVRDVSAHRQKIEYQKQALLTDPLSWQPQK